MEEIISIPIKKLEFAQETNTSDNLAKAKLYVLHEDLNDNNSVIRMDAIEGAKPTISNIPILTFIAKDEENKATDFGGHEMVQTLESEKGKLVLKTTYLEQPIGVIPESNDYHYEMIDDQNWVVVNGYVWKNYSNEAYDLLKKAKSKGISMEIKVLDGEVDKNTGFYIIKAFEYLGITVLGDDITPAMGEEAKIKMFSQNNKTEYFSAVKKLNEELKSSLENEVKGLSKKEFAKCEDKEKNIETNSCHDEKNKEKAEKNSCNEDDKKEKVETNSCHDDKKEKAEKNSCKDDKEFATEKVEDEDDESACKKNATANKNDIKEQIKEIKEVEDMMSCKDEKKKKDKSEKNAIEDCMEDDDEECLSKEKKDEKCFAKDDKKVTSNEGLSVNYVIEEVQGQLDEITETVNVWWQDAPATVPKYYMVDLLVDKMIVIVTDFENTGFFGIPYSISGDEVKLELDKLVPYISIWKEKDVADTGKMNFSKKKSVFEGLISSSEEVYNSLNEKYSTLEKECKKLKEFKLEVDKQTRFVQIDNKIAEFSFEEDEIKTLREMAYSEEISMEELEKELFALEGRRLHEQKTKFSSNKKQNIGYKILNNAEKQEATSKYGSASVYFR